MIKIAALDKSFDGFRALSNFNINVKKGSIYGLIGKNGAGKTTVINHLAGILKADRGSVTIEDAPVYDNQKIKERVGYIPDDLSYLKPHTLKSYSRFLRALYPHWNQTRFVGMTSEFQLDMEKRIGHFSKGMQKQAAFVLTMSQMPDYLLLDEPIDGLDPIVRKLVWKHMMDDVAQRGTTVLVSSHNLREMEGVCDCVGIIADGSMARERDLDDLTSDIHKVQVAFKEPVENPYSGLNILHRESRGTMDLLVVRNKKERVEEVIGEHNPAVFDVLPLSLEEIFIYELGGASDESILF